MIYYSTEQQITSKGVYAGYKEGYYVFILDNNDIVDFEQIKKALLIQFDLKSEKLKGHRFEIEYKVIVDDIDDEDFIILKLNNLKLL
ncbi:hypothetical protein [Tenacibaculum sp. M341]|uniref:hypothetical protein n=1 Tax=Tenacibaculum sp. M341 TaxID=2530339 RepID=UPI001051D6DB|nr:hypothetical protein [Tenacibaculum sp. M341]TCI90978.1 hypothetical protein EYW44_11540 [Tenacibaculum sp. M341]